MAIEATHKKNGKKKEREIVDRRTVQIYETKIMVEILRFEYDGTSFEDCEDLKYMKFFSEKKFSFSFAQISRKPNRGSLSQNSEFAFHNSKGREVKFQTECFFIFFEEN